MRVPFVAVVGVVGIFCSVVLWYSIKMIPDEAVLGNDFRDGMNVNTDERAQLRQVVERPYDAQNPTGFPTTTSTSAPTTTSTSVPRTTATTTTLPPTTPPSSANATIMIANATLATS